MPSKKTALALAGCAAAAISTVAGADVYAQEGGSGVAPCEDSAAPCDFATALGAVDTAAETSTINLDGDFTTIGGSLPAQDVTITGTGSITLSAAFTGGDAAKKFIVDVATVNLAAFNIAVDSSLHFPKTTTVSAAPSAGVSLLSAASVDNGSGAKADLTVNVDASSAGATVINSGGAVKADVELNATAGTNNLILADAGAGSDIVGDIKTGTVGDIVTVTTGSAASSTVDLTTAAAVEHKGSAVTTSGDGAINATLDISGASFASFKGVDHAGSGALTADVTLDAVDESATGEAISNSGGGAVTVSKLDVKGASNLLNAIKSTGGAVSASGISIAADATFDGNAVDVSGAGAHSVSGTFHGQYALSAVKAVSSDEGVTLGVVVDGAKAETDAALVHAEATTADKKITGSVELKSATTTTAAGTAATVLGLKVDGETELDVKVTSVTPDSEHSYIHIETVNAKAKAFTFTEAPTIAGTLLKSNTANEAVTVNGLVLPAADDFTADAEPILAGASTVTINAEAKVTDGAGCEAEAPDNLCKGAAEANCVVNWNNGTDACGTCGGDVSSADDCEAPAPPPSDDESPASVLFAANALFVAMAAVLLM